MIDDSGRLHFQMQATYDIRACIALAKDFGWMLTGQTIQQAITNYGLERFLLGDKP